MASKPTPSTLWRDLAIAVASLAFGVALVVVVGRLRADKDEFITIDDIPITAELAAVVIEHEGPGEASPQKAAVAFAAALESGDLARSFDLLSIADQQRYRTTSKWGQSARTIFGIVVGQDAPAADDDDVVSTLTLQAGLDAIAGLTPPSAVVTWGTVDEDGWRIDLGSTSIEAQLVSDDTTVDGAREWLAAGSACDPEAASDRAAFVGSDARFLQSICESAGAVSIASDSEPIDPVTAAPLISRFGADADSWARTVEVRSPIPGRLVLAPIGEQWLVIDVLSSS